MVSAMSKAPKPDHVELEDERSPEETERIREATLKRMLNTPPKPHADMVKERRKGQPKGRKR